MNKLIEYIDGVYSIYMNYVYLQINVNKFTARAYAQK